ncbi:DEAD/DEAH box helicase, partial [Streptomyces sp. WAC06614]
SGRGERGRPRPARPARCAAGRSAPRDGSQRAAVRPRSSAARGPRGTSAAVRRPELPRAAACRRR